MRPGALLVGGLGGLVSIGRLWLANGEAPTQVLWAEDGLFPLCVEKAGLVTCLTDPFAGYLLAAPRLAAGLVAQFPASSWALATNLLAAVIVGAICALAFAWSRRAGLSPVGAGIVGLLPVITPLVGVEAINSLGSLYMPLLFLSTLVVCLPSSRVPLRRGATWAVAVLLLLTALTIPLAALLLLVIVVQVVRRELPARAGVLWSGALVVGTMAQVVTALTAERPRTIAVGGESITSYFETLPRTIATLAGGRAEVALDGGFTLPSAPTWLGPVTFIALLALGIVGATRGSDRLRASGLMVLGGLAFGLVPSAIGWANNRYFVAPLMVWAAALVIAMDRPVARWATTIARRSAVAIALLGAAVVWGMALPASQWRATPAPPWQGEVERVMARCASDPSIQERPVLSPFWPPNWGDGLSEPTHPSFPCVLAWGWN